MNTLLVTETVAWAAMGVSMLMTLLTVSGLAYLMLALVGARDFLASSRKANAKSKARDAFTPAISLLKPVKGIDPEMMTAFRSHCLQDYPGEYELIFGVSELSDPATDAVRLLQAEFPSRRIELVVCPERLGTNGKVSNLVQMLGAARHEFCVINDGDIVVSPQYLKRVMAEFADEKVGLVTVPYRGRAGRGLWSRLEALGISTDFMAGVMTARWLEGGLKFGMGSTLAVRRKALDAAGGLAPLVEYLADDYELGVRISRAGYSVALGREVVETGVPEYSLRGFWEHQLRWMRTMKDSRAAGYFGMVVTYALAWALLNCIASGFALWSFSLLSLVLLVRMAVALTVGVGVLRDRQALRDCWLLPLRDCVGLLLWVWSYADNTVVWRGEKFLLSKGKLLQIK